VIAAEHADVLRDAVAEIVEAEIAQLASGEPLRARRYGRHQRSRPERARANLLAYCSCGMRGLAVQADARVSQVNHPLLPMYVWARL
jgi:hypothetical protein